MTHKKKKKKNMIQTHTSSSGEMGKYNFYYEVNSGAHKERK